MEQKINNEVKITFPPNLSVSIPIGNLKIEPESIGIPNNQPT